MSQNVETIYFLIFFISFLSVWFSNLIYSPIHKHLRNNKIYFAIIIIAILALIISINIIESNWETHQKANALAPIMLISYLVLYKAVDFVALKKYNRHIYFSCRISNFAGDEEAKESTWLEFILQFSILIISTFIWWKLGTLFSES